MTRTKKNPHLGERLAEYVRRRKAADPEYARLHDERFDKVQIARRIRVLGAKRAARALGKRVDVKFLPEGR